MLGDGALPGLSEDPELVAVDDFFLDYLATLEDQAGAPETIPPAPVAGAPLVAVPGVAGGNFHVAAGDADEGSPHSSFSPSSEPSGTKRKRSSAGAAQSKASARYRTAKQQLLNKQAQQRYRERKKQRQAELEVAVEQLSRKVEELREAHAHAEALRAKNDELQKALLARDAEIQRLKVERGEVSGSVSERWCDALPDPPGEPCSAGASGAATAEDAPSSAPVGANPECAAKLNRLFTEQIRELRAFWETHDIDAHMDGSDGPMPKDVDEAVTKRLENICLTCLYTLRAEGMRLQDVVERPDFKHGRLPRGSQRDLWVRVVGGLRLTPEQTSHVLFLRDRTLKALREIYIERQALNMDAITLLAPQVRDLTESLRTGADAPGAPAEAPLVERQEANHRVAGVVEAIRENLRKEQRALAELQVVVVKKVFTPVQACKAMLESYPFHCDVLSLANAVALTTRGSNAEGGQDSSAGASTPAPEEGVRPCLTHTVPAT